VIVSESTPEAPDAPPLGQYAGYLLIKLGELTLEAAERALLPLGLRARQFNVMTMAAANPALSQQDLSRLLGVDPTIMVALVDDLERQDLVRRERSQADRRRYVLRLTSDGRNALRQGFNAVQGAEAELLAPLTAIEAATFKTLAARLLAPLWAPATPGPGTSRATGRSAGVAELAQDS
jgi:DNA-binding MarR family transcriptional regulator